MSKFMVVIHGDYENRQGVDAYVLIIFSGGIERGSGLAGRSCFGWILAIFPGQVCL